MILRYFSCLMLFFLIATSARAQRSPDYDNVTIPQHRIDARELGYPPLDVIPNDESAITALTVAPDGNLFGVTRGRKSHLFVMNPRHGTVQPLGFLPEAPGAGQALAISGAGDAYIGTSPNGHLYKYVPANLDHQPINVKGPCTVADLGRVMSGEGIYAMTVDRTRETLYGLTSPNAHLFRYSIAKREFTDLGIVSREIPPGEKFETEKIFSRMLILDLQGKVYCSGENGSLFLFDPDQGNLKKLNLQAPAVPGRESWTRVDAFFMDPSGIIYGGTSDGFLFRFSPEKLILHNLGKPLLQTRIAGLVGGANGKIYGIGGAEDEMARLFSYDPETASYEIPGFIDVNRRPYYSWQAYVIKAMALGLDGTIYIGQSERISKLYLFYPW